MYEDPAIEAVALQGAEHVLAVASAGDVAMALARRGQRVTAIDVNPAQAAYVRARLRGAPVRSGGADRLLAAGRAVLRAAGWRPSLLDAFCRLDDPAVQLAVWRAELATPPVRRLLAVALRPAALRLGYRRAFALAAPDDLGAVLLDRVEAGIGRHPNRSNPWAHLLFRGRWPLEESPPQRPEAVRVVTGELADHLESVPPGTYQAFALSNVLDGPGPAYRTRLCQALRAAAAPGAPVLLRTLGGPASPADADRAALDRSLIWGGITVTTAREFR
jgi:S-adenosylmethionine:diacylglycerol 3-amino-3-carboxypropyl transferase